LLHNVGHQSHGNDKPDPGRFNVTRQEADRGAFKTPSLRSAALGAPYFHDASVATLKEALRYMAGGGRPDPDKSLALQPRNLSEREIDQGEIDQVVAFLESLTSTEPWQAAKLS